MMELDTEDATGTHPALTNSLILLKVFRYLPLVDLRQIRAVSQYWDVEASSLLGKVTHLNVASLCDHVDLGSWPMRRQLLRRVRVRSHPLPELGKAWCLIFLKTYRAWVQELVFCVDLDFRGTMTTLFESVAFSNLRKICIQEMDGGEGTGFMQGIPKIGIMPKIRVLQLDSAICERANNLEQTGHGYLGIFQELIRQSPNLTRVRVTGNVYPDLSSCSKLKFLTVTAFPVRFIPAEDPESDIAHEDSGSVPRRDFSINNLQEMLEQVNDGLEELVLRAECKDIEDEEDQNRDWEIDEGYYYDSFDLNDKDRDDNARYCRLPPFPNLTFLRIRPINGFIKEFTLSPNSFPLLAELDLSVTSDEHNDDLGRLLRAMGPRPGVKEVKFNVHHDRLYTLIRQHRESPFSTLDTVVANFPNVANLVIDWYEKREVWVMDKFPIGLDWMEKLAKFQGLEDLELGLDCKVGLSELMEGLGKVEFSGLKTLHLKTASDTNVTDDNCNNFQALFERTEEITFQGFSFKPSTVDRMRNYFPHSEAKKGGLWFQD